MKVVVIDTENNQPDGKVIQLGAVCVDVRSAKIVSSFNMYVDTGDAVSPFIVELTGITTDKLRDAGKPYPTVLTTFWGWVEAESAKMISAWGNDVDCIMQDSKDWGIDIPRRLRKLDIKSAFCIVKCGLPGSKVKGGLAATMKSLGMDFLGEQHNALHDARNTARLLVYLRELQFNFNLITQLKLRDIQQGESING